MIKPILLLSLLPLSLFANTITIAAAANVSYAFEDLKKAFNNHYPNTKVRVVLGSSGKLFAKISNGAPYDLFLSANMKYPNTLYKKRLALNEPIVYAKGSLAFLSKKPRNFSSSMAILLKDDIKKIAVANPKTAPYGVAAFEALAKAKILDTLIRKFVYGESISQTVSYALIAADIGIIAKSSLYSSKMKNFKENIHWATIDTQFYTPIQQGMVKLKHGQNKPEVQDFYDFILSDEAQAIFKTYGYQSYE